MIVELKDILPMHKGSGTYTEYDYTERLIEFRMDNPETNYFKIGHIHSHNSMATFFSVTDTSELHDNSKFHNYYLSVIVNNYFSITARIAFRGFIKSTIIQGYNENGEIYALNNSADEEVMFYYECNIVTNEPSVEVTDNFTSHVKFIIDEAAKPKNVPVVSPNSWVNPNPWVNSADSLRKNVHEDQPKFGYQPKRYEMGSEESYGGKIISDMEDNSDDESRRDEIEDFLSDLLTSHPNYMASDDDIVVIDDVFIYLKSAIKNIDIKAYFDYIMEQFPELYSSALEPAEGESVLDSDLEIMIEIVEEYRLEYKHANIFLNRLLNFQKQLA